MSTRIIRESDWPDHAHMIACGVCYPRSSLTRALCGVFLLLCLIPVQAQEFKAEDALTYARHTPGAKFMAHAQRAYFAGQFGRAFDNFMEAARHADKFAQRSIGAMYLRGEGVEQDPARGWAWLQLAAERGYPEMVRVAAQVGGELSTADLERGQAILHEELEPKFGDAVAVDRTAMLMRRQRNKVTGSRVGSVGALKIFRNDDSNASEDGSIYYDRRRWDFRSIVAFETRLMHALDRGRVELGEFRLLDGDDDRAGNSEAGDSDEDS